MKFTPSEAVVLSALAELGRASAAEISRWGMSRGLLGSTGSSIRRAARRLEAGGLVVRWAGSGRRGADLYGVTPEGREALRVARAFLTPRTRRVRAPTALVERDLPPELAARAVDEVAQASEEMAKEGYPRRMVDEMRYVAYRAIAAVGKPLSEMAPEDVSSLPEDLARSAWELPLVRYYLREILRLVGNLEAAEALRGRRIAIGRYVGRRPRTSSPAPKKPAERRGTAIPKTFKKRRKVATGRYFDPVSMRILRVEVPVPAREGALTSFGDSHIALLRPETIIRWLKCQDLYEVGSGFFTEAEGDPRAPDATWRSRFSVGRIWILDEIRDLFLILWRAWPEASGEVVEGLIRLAGMAAEELERGLEIPAEIEEELVLVAECRLPLWRARRAMERYMRAAACRAFGDECRPRPSAEPTTLPPPGIHRMNLRPGEGT